MSSQPIRVDPNDLHSAGSSVSGLAGQLQGGRGVGSNAAAAATGAAAHPDAQGALDSYWAETERKLGMTYALINGLADALHQSGAEYEQADRGISTEFGGHGTG